MCSIVVNVLDSPAVDPRSNPGSGSALLMSEKSQAVYYICSCHMPIDKALSSDKPNGHWFEADWLHCKRDAILLRVTSEYHIISLHDTPRLHTLKRVIRIFFIPRTYNDSNKLTLGYIHQNPTRNTKVALLLSNATVIFKISLQNLQNN